MQVERQPSAWPCVAMLAVLLLLCLLAPRYWQNEVTSDDPTIGQAADVAPGDTDLDLRRTAEVDYSAKSDFAAWLFDSGRIDFGRLAGTSNSDLLNSLAPPPIEELIATHAAMSQLSARLTRSDGEGFDWPVLVRVATGVGRDAPPSGPELMGADRPSPGFAFPFECVGGVVADYSSVDAAYGLAAEIADGVPQLVLACGEQCDSLWAEFPVAEVISPGNHGRSLVRIVGPGDRLAMLPAPRELDATRPWCVPQVLFEQLDRLANQSDSAQWASQIRNQLHALTDRAQLEGDDVQVILADLSDSAQEALKMADQTDNDRLRVELLRVHWCLPVGWIVGGRCMRTASRPVFRVAWPHGAR